MVIKLFLICRHKFSYLTTSVWSDARDLDYNRVMAIVPFLKMLFVKLNRRKSYCNTSLSQVFNCVFFLNTAK